jgi:hypothetical protein
MLNKVPSVLNVQHKSFIQHRTRTKIDDSKWTTKLLYVQGTKNIKHDINEHTIPVPSLHTKLHYAVITFTQRCVKVHIVTHRTNYPKGRIRGP